MKPVIKHITAYKGGTGKTTLSLMLLLHSIQKDKRVLVIDANPNNEDIYNYMKDWSREDDEIVETKTYEKRSYYINKTNNNKVLDVVIPTTDTFSLQGLFEFVKNVINTEKFTTCIVDYQIGMHVLARNKRAVKFPSGFVNDVYYIHDWAIGSVGNEYRREALLRSREVIGSMFPNFTDANFVHVFNPAEGKRTGRIFSKGLIRSLKSTYSSPREFFALTLQSLFNRIRPMGNMYKVGTELAFSDIPSLWEKPLKELLEEVKRQRGAISNLLVVPEHQESPYFASAQAFSSTRDIKNLKYNLEKIYKHVHAFELMRDRRRKNVKK